MKTIVFDEVEYEITEGNCKDCPFISEGKYCFMAGPLVKKYCLNGYTFKRIMTKKDIRPGMVVEFRNGTKALAVKVEMGSNHEERIIFIEPTGFMDLDSYNENLLVEVQWPYTKEELDKWDIMKIYDTDQKHGLDTNGLFSDKCIKEFELLWLREEIVEISLAEISEKFNVPISQIRIKE